jgi:glyoxylase-like metal-dependent hydrolase (beta-lactamase superfamily II)
VPLPLPNDGLQAVNVYVVEQGNGGLICIDGGWALEASRLEFVRALHTLGYHPRDVTTFLVTHAHRDHYTQAALVRDLYKRARVLLGAGERASLRALQAGRGDAPFIERLRRAGATHLARLWEKMPAGPEGNPPAWWQDPDQWLSDDNGMFEVAAGRIFGDARPHGRPFRFLGA